MKLVLHESTLLRGKPVVEIDDVVHDVRIRVDASLRVVYVAECDTNRLHVFPLSSIKKWVIEPLDRADGQR